MLFFICFYFDLFVHLILFAFNLLLILCLLLVFICIESLVAHAPLFAN